MVTPVVLHDLSERVNGGLALDFPPLLILMLEQLTGSCQAKAVIWCAQVFHV